SLTPDVYTVRELFKQVKAVNEKILTVAGGHHATVSPSDFFTEYVDLIVKGEGTQTFREIIETYNKSESFEGVKGIFFRYDGSFTQPFPKNCLSIIQGRAGFTPTPERTYLQDLDLLPFPDRKLTEKYRNNYFRASWRPVVSVMSSRGCPHRCKFCSVWVHEKGKYKTRSAENIVKELNEITEQYISFCDDNFLQDVNRAKKLYSLIKTSGMRKKFKLIGRSDVIIRYPDIIEKWREIGTELVLIGIESFRDEELRSFNKRNSVRNNEEAIRILHQNGITVIAQFIIGPDYLENDFEKLGDYVEKMELKHPIFSVLTPLPGTELYKERYNDLVTHNYELYDFVHPVLPTKLPVDKFCRCLANLYKRVYRSSDEKDVVSNKILEPLYESIVNAYKILQIDKHKNN
ncbi:MAG: radical SAM protein, partial [Elusimicrobiota bacterium]